MRLHIGVTHLTYIITFKVMENFRPSHFILGIISLILVC